jgi:YD repeat-containing protein
VNKRCRPLDTTRVVHTSDLQERWARLADAYEELRAEAEASVERWAWFPWEAELGRPQPLYRQRLGDEPRNEPFEEPPESCSDVKCYGFDSAGRVTVARDYDAFGNATEEFFFGHDGGVRWSARYVPVPGTDQRRPGWVAGETREGETLTAYYVYRGSEHWDTERYTYDEDGRLSGIEETLTDVLTGEVEEQRYTIEWDQSGRLVRIAEADTGTVYSASDAVDKRLLRSAEKTLQEEIRRVAERLTSGMRVVDGLLIGYTYESPMRPTVSPVEFSGAETSLDWWNPWSRERSARCFEGSPEFHAHTDDLERAIRRTDDDEVLRGIMLRVAKKLRTRGDWSFERGRSFFALPVDADFEDFEENAEQALPRKLRGLLESER